MAGEMEFIAANMHAVEAERNSALEEVERLESNVQVAQPENLLLAENQTPALSRLEETRGLTEDKLPVTEEDSAQLQTENEELEFKLLSSEKLERL
jgi:hypothetical protein